jgi:hypothetical protein
MDSPSDCPLVTSPLAYLLLIMQLSIALLHPLLVVLVVLLLLDLLGFPHPLHRLLAVPCVHRTHYHVE